MGHSAPPWCTGLLWTERLHTDEGLMELTLGAALAGRGLPSVRERGEEVWGVLTVVSVGGETM
jgi:hypothetical protein